MLGLMDNSGCMDETGRVVFSYAHPVFRTAFTLVGEGG